MAIKKQINIDVNASTAIKTLEELGGSFYKTLEEAEAHVREYQAEK